MLESLIKTVVNDGDQIKLMSDYCCKSCEDYFTI